jgi:hypothetical protein
VRKSGAILAVAVLVLLSAPAAGAAADTPDTATGVGRPASVIRATPAITSPKAGSFVNDRTVTFRGTTSGQVVQALWAFSYLAVLVAFCHHRASGRGELGGVGRLDLALARLRGRLHDLLGGGLSVLPLRAVQPTQKEQPRDAGRA